MPVDDRKVWIVGLDFDPRSDRRAIRDISYQFKRYPGVIITRILKKDVVVFIPVDSPPHLDEHIDRAVAVPVTASNTVTFLEIARTRRSGDVVKSLAGNTSEHAVGDQGSEIRVPGSEIEIEPTVVVKICEVRPHGDEHTFESRVLGDVDKSLPLLIQIQTALGLAVVLADHPLDTSSDGPRVVGGEDVLPSIVVKVPGPA